MKTTALPKASKPATIEGWLSLLSQSLHTQHKEDGTSYVSLSDSPIYEDVKADLLSIVRKAHQGEMPNDWRYKTIYHIVDGLLAHSEEHYQELCRDELIDLASDIAESGVDVYNMQLMQWVSSDLSRLAFEDTDCFEPTTDIIRLISARQWECIESMVHIIVGQCEKLCDR